MKSNLPEIRVPIESGLYLSQVETLNPFPSNCICHKTLPGLGATHGEITSNRHTILIEPNVPVIKGKGAKHPGVLTVYKGVYKDDVLEYLLSDISPKKIICTPEAYTKKVRPAFESIKGFDLFNDFFLLMDECDKLITDVDYRSAIVAPMEDFFEFKNKALVSATPIPPTFPKFAEQHFTFIKVEPQYEYKREIQLICTNNVVAALKQVINMESDKSWFVFINSTDTILFIINTFDITKESKVFCAEDSVSKLLNAGYKHAFADLTAFAKFNFLTSRFFSAVDIDLDDKPNVVMITDLFFAKHSILDPFTEVIQICGRFRKGVSNIIHISNIDSNIEFRSEVDALSYLNGCHAAYTQFLDYLYTNPDLDQGAKDTLMQALERVDHAKFVNIDGQINYFMRDNYLSEERVKSYYSSADNLREAYNKTGHFDLTFERQTFPLGDEDRLKRAHSKEQRDYFELVAEQLDKLHEPVPVGTYRFDNSQQEIKQLREACPEIYDAYKVIGLQGLKECRFRLSKIKKAVRAKEKEDSIHNTEMLDVIYDEFSVGRSYSESSIVRRLNDIYTEFGVRFKAAASHISRYFDTSRTSLKNGDKAYSLRKRKFRTKSEIERVK